VTTRPRRRQLAHAGDALEATVDRDLETISLGPPCTPRGSVRCMRVTILIYSPGWLAERWACVLSRVSVKQPRGHLPT